MGQGKRLKLQLMSESTFRRNWLRAKLYNDRQCVSLSSQHQMIKTRNSQKCYKENSLKLERNAVQRAGLLSLKRTQRDQHCTCPGQVFKMQGQGTFFFFLSSRNVSEIKEGIKSGVSSLQHTLPENSVTVSLVSQVGKRMTSKCNSQTQQETALWCHGI